MESNAIVRYLLRRHSEGLLYPTDPVARARGDRWMDWCSTTLAPVFRTIFWGLIRTPPEKRDMAAIAAAGEQVAGLLAMVDAELTLRRYLSGDDFPMGDIPLGCFVYAWFALPTEHARRSQRWSAGTATLQARPAFRSVIMTPLT